MNILIATVGTGSPQHPVYEAIVASAREHQADLLVMLCSRETATTTAHTVREELGWDDERFVVYEDAEINDAESLYMRYIGTIEDIKQRYPGARITIDYTSGTKSMSAALFAAGVARSVDAVSYVVGDRDSGGRGRAVKKIHSAAPRLMFAQRELALAGELFNRMEFAAAAQLADGLVKGDDALPEGPLRVQAKTLATLSQAYHEWELFNWAQAARGLKRLLNEKSGLQPPHPEVMQRQVDFVLSCDDTPWGLPRLVDLLGNAGRRIEQGRYDDAAARCYRAVEYLSQQRLARQYQHVIGTVEGNRNPTDKVPVDALPQSFRYGCVRNPGATQISLGLAQAYQLLYELGDELGKHMEPLYCGQGGWGKSARGPIKGLLDQRNNSWLAHGGQPVKEETARALLEHTQRLLTAAEPEAAGYGRVAFVRWG